MKKELPLQKRILIISITLISLVTLSLLVNAGISGSAIFGKTIQPVPFLKADNYLFMESKIGGLKDLTISFNKAVKKGLISINNVKKSDCDFQGKVYSMFKISSLEADKINKIRITLKLDEEKLTNLGINKKEVRLYNDCQELETFYSHTKGRYAYYTIMSKNSGQFLIGKATS